MLPESEDVQQSGFLAEEVLGVVRERVVLNEVLRDEGLEEYVKYGLFLDELKEGLLLQRILRFWSRLLQ